MTDLTTAAPVLAQVEIRDAGEGGGRAHELHEAAAADRSHAGRRLRELLGRRLAQALQLGEAAPVLVLDVHALDARTQRHQGLRVRMRVVVTVIVIVIVV